MCPLTTMIASRNAHRGGPHLYKQGHLEKQSRVQKWSWKRFFVRLENDKLSYYTEDKGQQKGLIDLSQVKSVRMEKENTIEIVSKSKRHLFRSKDAMLCEEWLKILNEASAFGRRLSMQLLKSKSVSFDVEDESADLTLPEKDHEADRLHEESVSSDNTPVAQADRERVDSYSVITKTLKEYQAQHALPEEVIYDEANVAVVHRTDTKPPASGAIVYQYAKPVSSIFLRHSSCGKPPDTDSNLYDEASASVLVQKTIDNRTDNEDKMYSYAQETTNVSEYSAEKPQALYDQAYYDDGVTVGPNDSKQTQSGDLLYSYAEPDRRTSLIDQIRDGNEAGDLYCYASRKSNQEEAVFAISETQSAGVRDTYEMSVEKQATPLTPPQLPPRPSNLEKLRDSGMTETNRKFPEKAVEHGDRLPEQSREKKGSVTRKFSYF